MIVKEKELDVNFTTVQNIGYSSHPTKAYSYMKVLSSITLSTEISVFSVILMYPHQPWIIMKRSTTQSSPACVALLHPQCI